jgi:uncharacterized protein
VQAIDSLVLKVAERCNLACTYCYMYHHADHSFAARPKFMDETVFDAMLDRVHEYCEARAPHSMALVFHGGEPTLLGPERFDRYAARAEERLGDALDCISVQTNATLIDERWIAVLKRRGVRVGVSIDGPPEIHDAARVDHGGRGSHHATLRGFKMMRDAGLDPGVLCVVNPGHSGAETYAHFRDNGIERMTFLLPDVSHDTKDDWYGEFGPTPVADYLIPVFDAWFAENDPSVNVRVFRDLMKRMMGGHGGTDAFGNPAAGYLIIESDGGIHALDALRVCGEDIADSGLNVLTHGFDDLKQGLPLVHEAVHEGLPVPTGCAGCPEEKLCAGGFLPHRYSSANGFDNPSVWCADIQAILGHMRERIGPRPSIVC